jgi:hypothetical protein
MSDSASSAELVAALSMSHSKIASERTAIWSALRHEVTRG